MNALQLIETNPISILPDFILLEAANFASPPVNQALDQHLEMRWPHFEPRYDRHGIEVVHEMIYVEGEGWK